MNHSGEGEVSELPETPRARESAPVPSAESSADSASRGAALARLVDIVDMALQAKLPRDFEPAKCAPQKLNEIHIQMIMDAHQGASLAQLEAKYQYHASYIGVILRHPDAITIKSYVLGMQADKVTDVQARLEMLAPEALTVKVALMRTTTRDTLKDKIASDLLAMAGYGERKKLDVEVGPKTGLALPAQVATGLADVLAESMRIADIDYSQHLAESPEGGTAQARPQLGSEPTSAGSLPAASPAIQASERAMAPEEARMRERLTRVA